MRHIRVVTLPLVAALCACATSPAIPERPPAVDVLTPSLAAAPDRFFTSGDARIRYRETGQGPPLVLIHGGTRRLDDWFAFADSLSGQYRVIALDLRGHGLSTRFTDPSRLGQHMVHDVVRLLDHLEISQAYFVGHSLGAEIAAHVAVRHPMRVRGATFIGGSFSADAPGQVRDVEPIVADIESGRDLRNLLRWLFPSLPDSVITQLNDETFRNNSREELVAIFRGGNLPLPPAAAPRVPALVAVGSADPLLEASRWLAKRWPNARLLEVAGADHLTVLFRPELLAAMRAHLR
jgi:pimeloyl-ACP methyl ester carboxylesterase